MNPAAPSAWRVQAAMSAAASFRSAMLEAEPDTDAESLALALDSETNVVDVLRRVVRFVQESDAAVEAVNSRINDLSLRRARYLSRYASARQLIAKMMEALDLARVDDPEFTASIGKARARAVVIDATILPDVFVRTLRSPDLVSINAAVRAGQVPAGVELTNGEPVLTIRNK